MSDKTLKTLKIFSSIFQFLFSTHKTAARLLLVALLILKKVPKKIKEKWAKISKVLLGARCLSFIKFNVIYMLKVFRFL